MPVAPSPSGSEWEKNRGDGDRNRTGVQGFAGGVGTVGAAMTGPLHARLGEEFFKQVPSKPGVYLMLGERDELLYVGKAKNLRTRLRSYARIAAGDDDRLVLLVTAIRAIKWEECPNEERALGRETELLRAMRPPFNFTHAATSQHLSIAVAGRGGRLRLRLTADNGQKGETLYGCFPFAAASPDAYKALLRAVFLAQPDAGTRIPSSLTRAAGSDFVLPPELGRSLRAFLAGRSMGLVADLEHIITEHHAGNGLVLRSAVRDLDDLRTFYELGPRAVRRLQQRHGAPSGSLTAQQLTDLMAREMGSQTGVRVKTDRATVTSRIAQLRAEQLGFRAIAIRLNNEGVPRLRGNGKWAAAHVAEIVGEQLAHATTTAALSASNLRQ